MSMTPEHQEKMRLARVKAQSGQKVKRPSMRKAINEMCKWCIYDDKSGLGTWRQQVGGCTSTECPLYLLRPLPDAKKEQVGPILENDNA